MNKEENSNQNIFFMIYALFYFSVSNFKALKSYGFQGEFPWTTKPQKFFSSLWKKKSVVQRKHLQTWHLLWRSIGLLRQYAKLQRWFRRRSKTLLYWNFVMLQFRNILNILNSSFSNDTREEVEGCQIQWMNHHNFWIGT